MGDMGSRLRLRRSAGARGPIIAVLLLLAAAPLGGTAAWSQSDGSVTVITGGSARERRCFRHAGERLASGRLRRSSATTTRTTALFGHDGDRRSGHRRGRPGNAFGRRILRVTTITGGSSSNAPARPRQIGYGGDGRRCHRQLRYRYARSRRGRLGRRPAAAAAAAASRLAAAAAAASAPPDVVSPGQDQPKAPIGSSTGEFRTSVDIEVPAFHGIEPHLSLAYGSSGGTEVMGVGWQIQGLSKIERTSSHSGAPVFDATDVYKLDDSELVACTAAMVSPSCDNGGNYATRIESYRRIDRNANNSWTVTDRDGTRYDYTPLTTWSTARPARSRATSAGCWPRSPIPTTTS